MQRSGRPVHPILQEGGLNVFLYGGNDPVSIATAKAYAAAWDVDPGDSACLPAKWLSADGTAGTLVFAGGDSFGLAVMAVTEEITAPSDRVIRWRLKRPFPLLPFQPPPSPRPNGTAARAMPIPYATRQSPPV